tara:strand:- start:5065 stop:5409 length:345 start_codon:yes stop_codon:yes gene_type:complete
VFDETDVIYCVRDRAGIALGDYVLASHFADADPYDPWRVGYVCQIVQRWRAPIAHSREGVSTYYVIGEADGSWSDHRQYRYARKISSDEGREWLAEHETPPEPMPPICGKEVQS